MRAGAALFLYTVAAAAADAAGALRRAALTMVKAAMRGVIARGRRMVMAKLRHTKRQPREVEEKPPRRTEGMDFSVPVWCGVRRVG